MTDVSESMLSKVRALLAQAESTSFAAEAEAFTEKAEALMAKYAIDQAMLADADPALADKIICRNVRILMPHLTFKADFLYNLANALDVKAAYISKDRREKDKLGPGNDLRYSVLALVGFTADVEWVETLFTSLEMQRLRALTEAVNNRTHGDHGRSFTVDFNNGWLSTVVRRVKATRQVAEKTYETEHTSSKSIALVLVGKRKQVEEEFSHQFPWSREGKRRVTLNSAGGYGAGSRAGTNANIARGSVGGNQKGLNR